MKEKLRIYGGARLEGEVMVSGEAMSSIRLWMGVSGRTTEKWMRTPEKDRYRLSSVKRIHPDPHAFVYLSTIYCSIWKGVLQWGMEKRD